jgi:hypothetical protein
MAKKVTEVLDDDGNVIAPPPPESPVAQAVWLLEYARKRRFAIPKITIGEVTIFATDLDQIASAGRDAPEPDLDDESDMAMVLRSQREQGG